MVELLTEVIRQAMPGIIGALLIIAALLAWWLS